MADFRRKKKELEGLYKKYRKATAPFTAAAVCHIGCADCCTHVGDVDTSTLEGYFILNYLETLRPSVQKRLLENLEEHGRKKAVSVLVRCAFLSEKNCCEIYPVRPFSCRRLYSLSRCGETGPVVHREAWQMAEAVTRGIQSLDSSGCSGHLSDVLMLLRQPRMLRAYEKGTLRAGDIPEDGLRRALRFHRRDGEVYPCGVRETGAR